MKTTGLLVPYQSSCHVQILNPCLKGETWGTRVNPHLKSEMWGTRFDVLGLRLAGTPTG